MIVNIKITKTLILRSMRENVGCGGHHPLENRLSLNTSDST